MADEQPVAWMYEDHDDEQSWVHVQVDRAPKNTHPYCTETPLYLRPSTPTAVSDDLVRTAARNIKTFIKSATFKCQADKEAALNCAAVLIDAAQIRALPTEGKG